LPAGVGILLVGSVCILIAVYLVRKNIRYMHRWLNKAPDESLTDSVFCV
jgi:hypothetical protein